jgi:alkylated DNA nucleotide flippase Atl1
LFASLFTRIRQKYSPFPVSCGITLLDGSNACFVRAREKRLLFTSLDESTDLPALIAQPHLPDAICIAAPQRERKNRLLLPAIQLARSEEIPLIYTEAVAVQAALGLETQGRDTLIPLLRQAGFVLRPDSPDCPQTALVALTGFFFLNKEYEADGKNVLPLLLEANPLFAFLRRIPYGEVATYREAAKELGLHWGEKELMQELHRLPYGADVPAHRLVAKDGTLSRLFPGGVREQRERLKWELVPFAGTEKVELSRAEWGRQKYKPLTNYLRHIAPDIRFVELRFHDLERIIGGTLPRAAQRLGSWWRDEKPYASIWLDAGWSVIGVNLQMATVTFSRNKE